jgi:tetratricopeptide (TPR) repeat protein
MRRVPVLAPALVSVLVSALALVLLASSAPAAVRFEPWQETSFDDAIDRAAREQRQVVLIVTQPDWCPPCIQLDEKWLKNPADTEAADILGDAMVLEVRGYEKDGGALLRANGIAFQGTPTTHVFGVPTEGATLGSAPLEGSVVGAPKDWPAQVKALLAGESPLRAAQQAVIDAENPLVRAHALYDLGELLAARGDANGASRAFRRVEWMTRVSLKTDEQEEELWQLKKKAAWERAATVDLRVRKDYRAAYRGINGWCDMYCPTKYRPSADELGKIAYARAWALQGMGRTQDALDELDRGLPQTADGFEDFLYFTFRSEDPSLLLEGERRVSIALAQYPERRAALMQALGRIQRKQGRLAEAEISLAEAVRLAPPGEDRMVYQSQLETVRRELAEKPQVTPRTRRGKTVEDDDTVS